MTDLNPYAPPQAECPANVPRRIPPLWQVYVALFISLCWMVGIFVLAILEEQNASNSKVIYMKAIGIAATVSGIVAYGTAIYVRDRGSKTNADRVSE
jgi:hypothetical protein